MNRFRPVRRALRSPSFHLGVSLALVACEGQVEAPLVMSDAGMVSSGGAASETVENARTPDSPTTSSPAVVPTSPAFSSTTPNVQPSVTTPQTMPVTPTTTSVPNTEPNDSTSSDVSSSETSPLETSSEQQVTSSEDVETVDVQPEFDIQIEFLSSANQLSAEVQSSFLEAEAFWENVIVGDLPDVDVRFEQACVPDQGAYVQGTIDDLHIFVAARSIDGVDGVLGAAGPCLSHASRNNLPLAGYMEFDTADLQRYADEGRLDEIIIHEMGHVLGFGGVLWTFPQDSLAGDPFLVNPTNVEGNDPSPPDTHFVGPHAIAEFDAIGGLAYGGAKVPVENVGGAGTANGHWREEIMGNELMTSFMTNREGVLSTVTIAALEDMGYTVNYDAADDYAWPPPDERGGNFLRSGDELSPIDFSNDVLQLPMRNVED